MDSEEVSQTLKPKGECCSLTFFLFFYAGCALLLNTSRAPAVANTVMTSSAFPAPLRNSPCEASCDTSFSFAFTYLFFCVWLWFSNIGTRSVAQQLLSNGLSIKCTYLMSFCARERYDYLLEMPQKYALKSLAYLVLIVWPHMMCCNLHN